MSTILNIFSVLQQGKAAEAAAQSEANAANYNAAMNEIQARQSHAAAGAKEENQRKQARAVLGSQLAGSAEAGAGLNTDLLRETLFNTEADAGAIRYEGSLKAQGLKDSAVLQRSNAAAATARGKAAKKASYLNAASALANDATKAYGGMN